MGIPPGKAFNAHLPETLHQVIKKQAAIRARKVGGQTNMNKIMVETLYEAMKELMDEQERQDIEKFIQKL